MGKAHFVTADLMELRISWLKGTSLHPTSRRPKTLSKTQQSIEPPFQREVLPGVVSTGISAQIGWGVRPSTFADRASQVIFGMDTSQYYLFAVLGPHVLPWQHIDYIWTIYHRPHLSYSLSSATSQGPQWHHLARFGLFLRPHFHHIYRSHC